MRSHSIAMALKKVVSEILWLIVIKFIAGVVVSLPDGTCKIRNTVFPVTKSSRLTGKTIIASDWFLGLIGNDIKFIYGYLQAQFSIKSLYLSILNWTCQNLDKAAADYSCIWFFNLFMIFNMNHRHWSLKKRDCL